MTQSFPAVLSNQAGPDDHVMLPSVQCEVTLVRTNIAANSVPPVFRQQYIH